MRELLVATTNPGKAREFRQMLGENRFAWIAPLAVAAFEDTILGYSLWRNGAKLALNKHAIADHLHDMTEDAFFHREFKVGYAIGRVRELYPEVARELGWDHKDFLSKPQAQLLHLVNSAPVSRKLLGYSLSMRLRNREAFYRGFVRFKREART